MTDTRFSPVDEVVREEAREPAKAWRNWYRAHIPQITFDGRCVAAGERYHGNILCPSKDVAETVAHKFMGETFVSGPRAGKRQGDFNDWLGAFPVEDT